MSATDDVIDRYLRRMPGARQANHDSAEYHAQIAFMRRMLTAVDMAMEDEGVPEAARLRVIRAVVYGAPDENAAELQRERMAALATATERALAPVHLGLWAPEAGG